MYLRGDTHAPPDSADYFEYHLRALARETPFADLTGDDAVTGDDLTVLAGQFAAGGVDGAQLLQWQRQVGQTPPDLATFDAAIDAALASVATTSTTAAFAATPEPASLGLAVIGAIALARVRPRAHRRPTGAVAAIAQNVLQRPPTALHRAIFGPSRRLPLAEGDLD